MKGLCREGADADVLAKEFGNLEMGVLVGPLVGERAYAPYPYNVVLA